MEKMQGHMDQVLTDEELGDVTGGKNNDNDKNVSSGKTDKFECPECGVYQEFKLYHGGIAVGKICGHRVEH